MERNNDNYVPFEKENMYLKNISFFKKIASIRVESDMSDDEEEDMIQDSSPVVLPTNVPT